MLETEHLPENRFLHVFANTIEGFSVGAQLNLF